MPTTDTALLVDDNDLNQTLARAILNRSTDAMLVRALVGPDRGRSRPGAYSGT
jgi:hypothetical protein